MRKLLFATTLFFFTSAALAGGKLILEVLDGKSQETPIKKITISSKNVVIVGVSGECTIPMEEAIKDTVKRHSCEEVGLSYKHVAAREFQDLFLNAENPIITCNYDKEGKMVGYNFFGNTHINGRDALVSRGVIFDIEPFDEVRKKREDRMRPLEELGRSLNKAASFILFN